MKSERFGPEPPSSLVELVDVSSREIYAACGFNAALWGGSSASVREAWRLALFSVLSPLGRLVESELRAKLDDGHFPILAGASGLRFIGPSAGHAKYGRWWHGLGRCRCHIRV